MSQATATASKASLPNLLGNPVVRQLGVMLGIALSVAIGVAVVLWSQGESYAPLFANLDPKDATEVTQALQQAAVAYRVDQSTGAILVPAADLHRIRMQLAAQGLPRDGGLGFEILQKDPGLGVSRALEAARFQRAMEGELARSIEALGPVGHARVHLAIPKQSVFVRRRKAPSASVVIELRPGRVLDPGQVDAITHLVASSVPELAPSKVTLVDQKGRLLSGRDRTRGIGLSGAQFDYTRRLEDHYRQRVIDILTPLLGEDAVRAEVTADLDFTQVETTQEQYNPDQPALRSEQTDEEESRLDPVQGVPGALSNQPPAAGSAPEKAIAGKNGGGEPPPKPVNISKRATRNYELDRVLSHTRTPIGRLQRLSVAVVVDDRVQTAPDGQVTRVPRSPEELNRIEELVRQAVGYDPRRNDQIRVVNAAFHDTGSAEPLPEPPLWERPWFWDLVRQAGGVSVVLILVFAVVRPALRRLTQPPSDTQVLVTAEGPGALAEEEEGLEGELSSEQQAALESEKRFQLPGPRSYEQTLEAARQLVREDPKRVAQVVHRWIEEDAG